MPITTPQDVITLFGSSYIAWDDFQTLAPSFGASKAISGWADIQLQTLVSHASRLVEIHTHMKTFDGATVTENHRWDMETRRVRPNNPPVQNLISYQIQTAPGQFTTFPVSAVYINNQENYLELAALTVAGTITSQLLSLGLMEIQAIIQYTSYASVPSQVRLATAVIAADLAQKARAGNIIVPGLASIEDAEQSVTREAKLLDPEDWPIPPYAQALLQQYTEIIVV